MKNHRIYCSYVVTGILQGGSDWIGSGRVESGGFKTLTRSGRVDPTQPNLTVTSSQHYEVAD